MTLQNLKKKKVMQMNLQNRNRLTDLENELMDTVVGVHGGGEG